MGTQSTWGVLCRVLKNMQPILYLSGLFLLATPILGDGEKIVGGEEAAPNSIPGRLV